MLALFPDIRCGGINLDADIALSPGQRLGRHRVLPWRPYRATCRSPGAPGVVSLEVLRARRLLAPNGARARRAVDGRPRRPGAPYSCRSPNISIAQPHPRLARDPAVDPVGAERAAVDRCARGPSCWPRFDIFRGRDL